MSRLPLYVSIKQDLKRAIDAGEFPEGARVPSELDLARQYGVSRNPTRQALRELEIEGYLKRSRRRGSFVTPASYRARRLNVSQGRVVAIVCPHGKSAHVRGIVEAFVHRAGTLGSHVMVYFMEWTDQNQSKLLMEIRQSGIAGVALWLADDRDQTLEVLDEFSKTGYPFVLLDRYVRGRDYDFVVTDNEFLAYAVTRELIRRGHRLVAYLSNQYRNTANEDRFAGYRRALEEARVSFHAGLAGAVTSPGHVTPPGEIERVVAHKSRPTAFFCAQDWIAARVADILAGLGYSVPEDMELGSVDDGELTEHAHLKIVMARQQSEEIGRQGAEVLISRLEVPQEAPRQRLLKPVLNFEQAKAPLSPVPVL